MPLSDPRYLRRVQSGLVVALDLADVADGTELHGWNNWTVFTAGTPTGIFEVRDGEIHQLVTTTAQMALWADPDLTGLAGHAIQAETTTPVWGTTVPGLCVDGELDHDLDIRLWIDTTTYHLYARGGAGDYGSGAPVRTGAHGVTLVGDVWHRVTLGAVHQSAGIGSPRGSYYLDAVALGSPQDTTLGTGANTGDVYPGIFTWGSALAKWRNLQVTRDYRLTVQGLTGTQAFQLHNAAGVVLKSSLVQSGGSAWVDVGNLVWPFAGYVQVYTSTAWTTLLVHSRYPGEGHVTDLYGGDLYDAPTRITPLVQCNLDANDTYPDEWETPPEKNFTPDLKKITLSTAVANPGPTVDTCTLLLRDPDGKYVAANPFSTLYPNLRLGRTVRVVAVQGDTYEAVFFGQIAEITPILPMPDDENPEQWAEIRCEGLLRKVAVSNTPLTVAPVGALVVAGTPQTGVIPTLLTQIADVVPVDHWNLDVTADTIDFLADVSDWATAMEQCAIVADAIWWVKPLYKTAPSEHNYELRWQSRAGLQGATADHDWNLLDGDLHRFTPRYTGDET